MNCRRIVATLLLSMTVCTSQTNAAPYKLRADFSNSDPGAKLDEPRFKPLFAELGYLANTLYGRATVLTVKNSQFLGQPLLAKLEPEKLGLGGGQKYDYYLLSMQFNVPAVRNIPLNKYRYVRFDSIFSIQPESQEFLELSNAIKRLNALEEPMAFPLGSNKYIVQRQKEILSRLTEIVKVLNKASSDTENLSVRQCLRITKQTLLNRAQFPVTDDVYATIKAIQNYYTSNAVCAVACEPAEVKDPVVAVGESLEALELSYQAGSIGSWEFNERRNYFNKAVDSAKAAAEKVGSISKGNKQIDSDLKTLTEVLKAETNAFEHLTGSNDEQKMAQCVRNATQAIIPFYKKAERYKGKAGVRNRIVYGNYKELEHVRGGSLPWNFNVVSIHPTNEVLDVKFQNVQDFDVKVEPKYLEFSGASANWHSKDTTDYNFKLPRVVGITNHFGSVSWTYYPAKRQPVMLGNKTTFAVLQVKRGTGGSLRLNTCLNYELLLTSPFIGPKMYDEAEISLDEAMPLDSMLRMRCAELSGDAIGKLFGDTFKEPGKPSPELVTGEDQPPMIKYGKKFYRFDDDSLNCVEFDEEGKPSVQKLPFKVQM